MTTDLAARPTAPSRPGTPPEPLRRPSVIYPVTPVDLADPLRFAGLAHSWGVRCWMGHSAGIEAAHVATAAAGAGTAVPFGTAVELMPLVHPWAAARSARSVALVTGQPMVAGLGVGDPASVARLTGRAPASPLTYAAEYLTVVRSLLRTGRAAVQGRYLTVDTGFLPVAGPPVEVGLGVLRAGLARVAGAHADVAISWLAGPAHVSRVLVPALAEGAASVTPPGHPIDPPRLTAVVPVVLDRPGRDPAAILRAGHALHFAQPHYRGLLAEQGVHPGSDDPLAVAQAVLAAGIALTGGPDAVVDGLVALHRAGVDEVVLNPLGVLAAEGASAALADLTDIGAAVTARLQRN